MKPLSHRQKHILEKIGILCIALLFIVVLLWFISSTKELYRSGQLLPQYHMHGNTDHIHPMMNVRMIAPWMTFNYLNIVFRLPPDYLQNTFSITDPRYPNIRLDYYIKHNNLDTQTFIQNIGQAITSYTVTK